MQIRLKRQSHFTTAHRYVTQSLLDFLLCGKYQASQQILDCYLHSFHAICIIVAPSSDDGIAGAS